MEIDALVRAGAAGPRRPPMMDMMGALATRARGTGLYAP
jgi:hypothetical protein